jgi:D-alanyl-D-alanine carboxypeptidase
MAKLLEESFAGRAPVLVAGGEPGLGSVVSRLNPISQAVAAPVRAPKSSDWEIQVGAYSKLSSARRAAVQAASRVQGETDIKLLAPYKSDKRKIYRARLVGFSEDEARTACQVLKKRKTSCTVIEP